MLRLEDNGQKMEPRPAATILLLRAPFEVLMVKRNTALAFMGGFWVFPGGKVEEFDGSPEQAARRELTEETGIELSRDAELVPFARWITPVGIPKRFDTWFFLTSADGARGAGAPQVDGSEIVEARWLTPAAALEDPGILAFPTRKTLEELSTHASAEALIRASRGKEITAVLPEIVHDDGAPAVVVPGSGEPPRRAPEAMPQAPRG
jgi:8-oxo-dGTP pyrophosphatase MutT (NUDIX family)